MAPAGKKSGGKKGKVGKVGGGAKRKVKGSKPGGGAGKKTFGANNQAKQSKKTKHTKAKTKANRLLQAQVRAEAEAEVQKQEEGGLPADAEPEDDDEVMQDMPRSSSGSSAVMFMGGIPEGFAEPQIKKYFSQFGTVTRIKLARSKKTARCKGYGWVEFAEYGVAKIAAETMNGYLMFDSKLRCHLVPEDKVHDGLFRGWNRKMVNRTQARRAEYRAIHNGKPTVLVDGELVPRITDRQVKRQKSGAKDKRLKELLSSLEVDFDPSAADEKPKKTKAAATVVEEVKTPELPVAKVTTDEATPVVESAAAKVQATDEAVPLRKKGLKKKKASQKL